MSTTNNSVKITYIFCKFLYSIILLLLAIFIPIYITPGYYYWTAFCLLFFVLSGIGFSSRVNSWGDFGHVE